MLLCVTFEPQQGSDMYVMPLMCDCTLQDQAAALHAMGMMGYTELKGRLMSTTAFLVASGSLIAFSAGGGEAAYPFALGGSGALGYQWLLQQSVDSIPSKIPRRPLVKVSCLQERPWQLMIDTWQVRALQV